MTKLKKLSALILALLLLLTFCACGDAVEMEEKIDNSSKSSEVSSTAQPANESDSEDGPPIMSSDRVMSNFFDISVFDEENYADIYLGKKFQIDCTYAEDVFTVPTTIDKMKEIGWDFSQGNAYDENSLVFSYETIETVLQNERGTTVKAWFYNSSRSSKKLSECNIVKFLITNDFYSEIELHEEFNVNGITDSMTITDIIEKLGTPSHFYEVREDLYYLDFFISKKDRRNGITVYVNPIEDSIVSFEISYYK